MIKVPNLGRNPISRDRMRREVFDPVFSKMSEVVLEALRNSSSNAYLLFSGVLAEADYLRSFMNGRLHDGPRNEDVHFLTLSKMGYYAWNPTALNHRLIFQLEVPVSVKVQS